MGDFSGDSKTDLALVAEQENRLLVFIGRGDATFQEPTPYHLGNGSRPHTLAVCDLNKDGKFDIVVPHCGETVISVLVGLGDGAFQDPVRYDSGTYPEQVAVADFNGDGNPDVVVAFGGEFKTSLHLGRGDGTLEYPIKLPTTWYAIPVAAADFDSDGRPDFAVAESLFFNRTAPSLRIRPNAAGIGCPRAGARPVGSLVENLREASPPPA